MLLLYFDNQIVKVMFDSFHYKHFKKMFHKLCKKTNSYSYLHIILSILENY